MSIAPPDYVILGIAAGGAVTGLFIGFSGALAFLSGTVAAVFAARFGWTISESFLQSGLARGLAAALATVLAFWIVRTIVHKTIKLALAQPGDSIFGAIAAAAAGLALGLGIVWAGQFLGIPGTDGSVLLEEVIRHVG